MLHAGPARRAHKTCHRAT